MSLKCRVQDCLRSQWEVQLCSEVVYLDGDTWPEWRSSKLSLCALLSSGLFCHCPPVCPHSIDQDTSPSCPRGVCARLRVYVYMEGGGLQA